MPEKEPYQPSPEEIQAAESSMTDIQRMDTRHREKAAKDGERVKTNKKGDSMLIKGNEIFLGRYMTVQYAGEPSVRGKKEFEEETISAGDALERLEQDETGVEMEMERLHRIMDNIGILKNLVLEIRAKQEKKEN